MEDEINMGVSTSAILFYGIQFEEEEEVPAFMEGFEDFESYILTSDGINQGDGSEEHGCTYEEKEAHLAAVPVELVSHCHINHAMYGLAVKGTVFEASRGYPHEFENGMPEISQKQLDRFGVWCINRKIELQKPRWILCSDSDF